MKIPHHANRILFFVIVSVLFACNQTEQPKKDFHRLIHNNDGTDMLGNRWFGQRPITVADVNACVDMVADGTQVTTYMMCSGSDFLYYRSKYGPVIGDDLNGTINCGKDTTAYKEAHRYYLHHLALEKEGTDVIAASLNRAKEKGLEAFITYRMNDIHFADTTEVCPIWYAGGFWRAHPEYWTHDTAQGWHSGGALDFLHQEVRDHKLAIISEQLDKYDMIDGFDLDFMRFIVYFKGSEGAKKENTEAMTQLVKNIKAKVDEVSAKRGKKILLSVRVPSSMESCREKGLDVKDWIRLGLVDFVSIGVHWRGDPAISVAKFKKELNEPSVPIYVSVDDGGYRPREFYSQGMHRGMVSHALAQGADGIYLFNYYLTEYNMNNKQLQTEPGGQVCRMRAPEMLKELGSLETLRKRNKVYCLSDGVREYNLILDTPLPLKVSGNGVAPIYIGDDVKTDRPEEVILFVRTNRPVDFKVQINGKSVDQQRPEYVALYDKALGLENKDTEYAFVVPAESITQGFNQVMFNYDGSDGLVVKRVEIALKYGDVETHGYF